NSIKFGPGICRDNHTIGNSQPQETIWLNRCGQDDTLTCYPSIQNLCEFTLAGYIYAMACIALRVDESQCFISLASKENVGVHTHLLSRVHQFVNIARKSTCIQDVDGTSELSH